MPVEASNDELVVVHDAPLRVQILGDGPPLVVLHGLLGAYVTPGLEALSEHYQLVMPEHPGFGHSPQLPAVRHVPQLALLYLDLMDQLGQRDAPVLGHSFGGWVAAEMAVQASLSKLVLADAMGCRVDGEDREDIFLRSRDSVLDLVFEDRTMSPTDGTSFEDVRSLNGLAHYGWNPYLCDLSLRERLHRIKSPTLIMWGQHDRVVPLTHANLMASEIATSAVVEFPGVGHDPTSERPSEFAVAVTGFLGGD